jgi:transcriptional regulator with GAF, ATPase, and Fis domain
MESKTDFSQILNFFRGKPPALPGEPEYNAAFCKTLVSASSSEEASIWQLDSRNQLHPIYGTNFIPEEVEDVCLREGEGIGGAVAMTRQTMAVSQVVSNSRHDRRLDDRIGFRTRSMISAPIQFADNLYGVLNVLNHISGSAFTSEWQEKLSTVGVMYAAALVAGGRLRLYDESPIQNETYDRKVSRFSECQTVIVGASYPIQEVLNLCVKAARSDITVLICGETGTGKELAARRMHEASSRASGPFVDVNCAAITETLLESELFGHVKGAFSGATSSRQGKFVAATGGTLFLDEIGNMSPTFQAKILRVLQEKKLSPVGSDKTIKCNARIVAATNQDLREKIEKGTFRDDLFYRLCGIEILMPSLRERHEDVQLLAKHFLNRACAEQKERDPLYQAPKISDEAFQMLMAYSWPGNVRQLEQAVLAALAICETDEIQPSDLPVWFQKAIDTHNDEARFQPNLRSARPGLKTSTLEREKYPDPERLRYLKALDSTKYSGTGRWNLSAAARQLGVPRKTLIYRLKKMQLIK